MEVVPPAGWRVHKSIDAKRKPVALRGAEHGILVEVDRRARVQPGASGCAAHKASEPADAVVVLPVPHLEPVGGSGHTDLRDWRLVQGHKLLSDARTLPHEAEVGASSVLEEVNPDGVPTSAQVERGSPGTGAVESVVVDAQTAVDPEFGTIVRPKEESVATMAPGVYAGDDANSEPVSDGGAEHAVVDKVEMVCSHRPRGHGGIHLAEPVNRATVAPELNTVPCCSALGGAGTGFGASRIALNVADSRVAPLTSPDSVLNRGRPIAAALEANVLHCVGARPPLHRTGCHHSSAAPAVRPPQVLLQTLVDNAAVNGCKSTTAEVTSHSPLPHCRTRRGHADGELVRKIAVCTRPADVPVVAAAEGSDSLGAVARTPRGPTEEALHLSQIHVAASVETGEAGGEVELRPGSDSPPLDPAPGTVRPTKRLEGLWRTRQQFGIPRLEFERHVGQWHLAALPLKLDIRAVAVTEVLQPNIMDTSSKCSNTTASLFSVVLVVVHHQTSIDKQFRGIHRGQSKTVHALAGNLDDTLEPRGKPVPAPHMEGLGALKIDISSQLLPRALRLMEKREVSELAKPKLPIVETETGLELAGVVCATTLSTRVQPLVAPKNSVTTWDTVCKFLLDSKRLVILGENLVPVSVVGVLLKILQGAWKIPSLATTSLTTPTNVAKPISIADVSQHGYEARRHLYWCAGALQRSGRRDGIIIHDHNTPDTQGRNQDRDPLAAS
mmetsp:Transcript_13923/g.32379  ORF Transcript_13923/g.32379 Transcript_13923/m.32379 type:complete len:726 (+) Transcript_13923:661-2838(+)